MVRSQIVLIARRADTETIKNEEYKSTNYRRLTPSCQPPSRRKRRGVSSKPLTMLVSNRPNRWSCAPPPASLIYGSSKANVQKLTDCCPRSTAGLPKGLIPKVCKRPRRCWRNYTDANPSLQSIAVCCYFHTIWEDLFEHLKMLA